MATLALCDLARRVHNGQSLVIDQQSCEEGPPPDLLMGLFGTTAFYDHVTSTQLVPLDKAVRLTRLLRSMRVSNEHAWRGCHSHMVTATESSQIHGQWDRDRSARARPLLMAQHCLAVAA